MNLIQHPELIDRLAASFALGTLRGGARRRFEALAREHTQVRVAALAWQARIASLNELQAASDPSPAVWTRIDNLVQGEKDARAMQLTRENHAREAARISSGPPSWLRSLALWRGATAAGALATAVVVVTGLNLREQMGGQITELQAKLLATPNIEYVAVLSDDKQAASMLVTFDAKNKKLMLQRVGGFHEPGDRSLQLWALPPTGGPKSLGVLGTEPLLRLTAAEGDVREV
ncbi:MAG: anti-sigma factor, partial [Rhodoferax sp.]|nr:anti-sigma factor [Rhodoferax sp.]